MPSKAAIERANPDWTFVCLDPKKQKRATVQDTLSRIGAIRWIRFAPLGLRPYPETKLRAATALNCARFIPKSSVKRALKQKLLEWQYNGSRAIFENQPKAVAVCWNGLNGSRRVFMDAARDAGSRCLFFELAPLPGRITVDPCGVNFANSLPRKIEPYLEWFTQSGLGNGDWREAGRSIKQRSALSPQIRSQPGVPSLAEPYLFVPLQTPGDSQLRIFGGAFDTVEKFIDAVMAAAQHLPEGWHLRIKEHPTAGVSFGEYINGQNNPRVFVDNATDTFEQVAASRGVVTVNSSVGLEAMFFDKPVVAAGQCFWAIEGVATSGENLKKLSGIFKTADSLDFSTAARSAFLGFLTGIYYPEKLQGTELDAKIWDRLNGRDQFGFWSCQSEGSIKQ